jgi:glc operon protein GlcG
MHLPYRSAFGSHRRDSGRINDLFHIGVTSAMRKFVPVLATRICLGAFAVSSVAASAHAAAPLTTTYTVLTNAGAQAAVKAAEHMAAELNAPSAIAVVDPSGNLLAFERLDGVRIGSIDLAIGKARSAALLQRPSEQIEDNINKGRLAFATAGFLSLRGGIPISVNGQVVGAIGIAGMNKDNDVKIATAAAQQVEAALEGTAAH